MKKDTSEEIIRLYFESWVKKDPSVMKKYFAENITYTECYGPQYRNLDECLQWFNDWNKIGSVLQWEIRQIDNTGKRYYVEWFFQCEYEGNVDGFDGVSIVEFFPSGNRISLVKEFQSKPEHYFPYGNEK